MKEKWLSVQKDCKFKYYDQKCCTLHHLSIPCNIDNCQIFKSAKALLQPDPKLTKLTTLYDLLDKVVDAVEEVCSDSGRHDVAEKKAVFQCKDGSMLKIEKCGYVNDCPVYRFEDY